MANVNTIVKHKKGISKKKKASWRKHINIDDVENFLEEKRLIERLGPELSSISNKDLFTLDTQHSQELTSKQRKLLLRSKPLKCFSALESHTKVPDPIVKRNRVKSKEERKSIFVQRKDILFEKNAILKQKQLHSIQDKKLHQAVKASNTYNRGDFSADLWKLDFKDEPTTGLNDEFVTKNTKKHNLKNSGVPQKLVLNSIKEKKSSSPSIEPPHPGMSYNPSFADHSDLLNIVGEKEIKLIKKEKYLTRVTKGMFNKVTEAKRDCDWLIEMSEGLPSKQGQTKTKSEYEELKVINPPVENVKKTLKQRRKQKEQRKLALAIRAKKIEKKKISDIHQVKALNKKMDSILKKQEVLRGIRKEHILVKQKAPKRLGSIKFEDIDLDFNLGTDLTGTLRNIKKEGNLLNDRFKSLQKRNILEPTLKRTRKLAKVKRYTKPGHKEDWIKTIAK